MKLLDYIKGDRRGRDARRIELDAMRDPLLHDALEGFDSVPGDHEQAVERLRKRLQGRVAVRRSRRLPVWRVAAAVVLVGALAAGIYVTQSPDRESVSLISGRTELEQMGKDIASDTAVQMTAAPAVKMSRSEVVRAEETAEIAERRLETNALADIVLDDAAFEEADMFLDAMAVVDVVQEQSAEMASVSSDEIVMSAEVNAEEIIVNSAHRQAHSRCETASVRRHEAAGIYTAAYDAGGILELQPSQLDSLTALRGFEDYVMNNMVVPEDAAGVRISGAAIAEFTADDNGNPKRIRILESPGPAASREARRLIESAPEWPSRREMRVVVEF